MIRVGDTVHYAVGDTAKQGIAAQVGAKSVRLEGSKKRIPFDRIVGYEKPRVKKNPKKTRAKKNPRIPQTEYGYRFFTEINGKKWYVMIHRKDKTIMMTDNPEKALVIGTLNESETFGRKLAKDHPVRQWYRSGP